MKKVTLEQKGMIIGLVIALLLAIFLVRKVAADCVCYMDWDNDPECCLEIIAWPGSVIGVPCYGKMCQLEDGRACNCTPGWPEWCDVMCNRRAVALARQEPELKLRVETDIDLCFGSPLPEPFITPEVHADLINSGTVDLENLGQDNIYCHWIASGHTLVQWESMRAAAEAENMLCQLELDECLNPPAPVGPDCTTTLDFIDGGGGSLWKPVSESNGKPVVLMPRSYCQFETIGVWAGATVLERPRLSNCSENGPRGHWRLNRRCEQYPDNLIVAFGTECRHVPDPCVRYD